ncbi:MAG: hypothetical protein ACI4XS_05835 [Bacillus sp. (in: firmicutes)]
MNILMPITLIFLLIILIVIFRISNKVVNIKNMNIAFVVYISILVVSTMIYFIIPKPEVQTEAVQNEGQFDEQFEKVYTDIESGRIDQLNDNIIAEQSFDYNGNELILKVSPGMEAWYVVFVEIKDDHDGIVNFTQLHTGAYVNDIDVSEYLNPAEYDFKDGQLIFNDSEPVYIKKTSFNKEFPITQFSGNDDKPFGYSSSSSIGSIVMYIQVPKDVVVKNETGFDLQYVEK